MKRYLLILLATGMFLQADNVNAQLVITEVMSSSGAPADGSLDGLDWWELTNTGTAEVALAGYEWEDSNPSGNTAIFPAVTISAGESIILHQGDTDETPSIETDFRAAWNLDAAVQVFIENDMVNPPGIGNRFSGLSSNGDEVNLFDPTGTLLDSVTFDAATAGESFEWDLSGNSIGLSVVGENGAFASTYGGVASPGVAGTSSVPEPSSLACLAGTALLISLRRRR